MHDPRTNLYRTIHKAIRSLLGELSQLVGATDFSSPEELASLRARVGRDFGMLTAHAHHEDEHILPLLEQHSPAVAQQLTLAHSGQHATMPQLLAQLAAIEPGQADVEEKSDAFRLALSRYMAHQLEHMADEEELAMAALYACFEDAQLVAVHEAILQSVSPAELIGWLPYMIPAMSAPERAGMLAGMRATAPAGVFEGVLALAREALPAAAFRDLQQRLGLALEQAA